MFTYFHIRLLFQKTRVSCVNLVMSFPSMIFFSLSFILYHSFFLIFSHVLFFSIPFSNKIPIPSSICLKKSASMQLSTSLVKLVYAPCTDPQGTTFRWSPKENRLSDHFQDISSEYQPNFSDFFNDIIYLKHMVMTKNFLSRPLNSSDQD